MNWVDGAIIGIVVVYALIGFKRGFLVVASELVTLALGLGLAFLLYRPVGVALARSQGLRPGVGELGAFFGIWVLVQVLAGIAFHLWLRRVPKPIMRSPLNRVLGIFPSLLKGIVAAALITTLLSLAPTGSAASDVKHSRLGSRMVAVVVQSEAEAYNRFRNVISDVQASLGHKPVVEGFQKLPFHTTDVDLDPEAEVEMLRLLNQERRQRGLEPLVMDDTLRSVARKHSKDMLARGYFSHETPDGTSPFDRMHAAGVTYRVAGENLAFAMTVEVAHDGLMKSPGHRKNILLPDYRKVGIGAVRAGARGVMFTQNFTD